MDALKETIYTEMFDHVEKQLAVMMYMAEKNEIRSGIRGWTTQGEYTAG